MKKNPIRISLYLCFFALCSALLLTGCSTSSTQINYQSGVPLEKTATLNIIGTITVRQFDGKDVRWGVKFLDTWATVRIPEGSHTFLLNYSRVINARGDTHYLRNITITYNNFIAGRTYQLIVAEGADAATFLDLFKNPIEAMMQTANRRLRVGIRDVTDMPQQP